MKLVHAPGTTCQWKIPDPNLQAARTLEAGTVTLTSMINVMVQTFAGHISSPAHSMLPAFLKYHPHLWLPELNSTQVVGQISPQLGASSGSSPGCNAGSNVPSQHVRQRPQPIIDHIQEQKKNLGRRYRAEPHVLDWIWNPRYRVASSF